MPSASKSMCANGFDLVSSLMMAIVLMLGCLVLVLGTLWATRTRLIPDWDSPAATTHVSFATSAATPLEFEIPAGDEVVALEDPTLKQTLGQIEQQIQTIPLASVAVRSAAKTGIRGSTAGRIGADQAESNADKTVPRHQRWHLVFKAPHQTAYARQLDVLGIELGAFGGDLPGIDSAGDFALGGTAKHNGKPKTEKRLYFSWAQPSPLARYERSLLIQAGVPVAGRQVVKFIPRELENRLATMELEYAFLHGVASVTEIEKTVFESQRVGQQYRFVVTHQRPISSEHAHAASIDVNDRAPVNTDR
ncbi:hypothetical protein K239x_06680 [Planctomycetes bacterium K23_9]|uniref:Uncharacterized protein n=2 Tax=Stieleria marina TaxID=1930275 RepID=A0A517NNM3_9BACT|nr:hypothetical protein K239x_06680 [Planctomycetes bacterium K23_9]